MSISRAWEAVRFKRLILMDGVSGGTTRAQTGNIFGVVGSLIWNMYIDLVNHRLSLVKLVAYRIF